MTLPTSNYTIDEFINSRWADVKDSKWTGREGTDTVRPGSNKLLGDFRFLSNFYEWPNIVDFNGVFYSSTEAAYQAAKSLDPIEHKIFATLPPADSKRRGRAIKMRPDWESIKLEVVEALLRQKFSDRNPHLVEALLATGDAVLVEGNYWGDTFWGVCRGKGLNHLGRLLMERRAQLRTAPRPRHLVLF